MRLVFEMNECCMKLYFNFLVNLPYSIQHTPQIKLIGDGNYELFKCICVEGITFLFFHPFTMIYEELNKMYLFIHVIMCCSIMKDTMRDDLNTVHFHHFLQHIPFLSLIIHLFLSILMLNKHCIVSFTVCQQCTNDILTFLSE